MRKPNIAKFLRDLRRINFTDFFRDVFRAIGVISDGKKPDDPAPPSNPDPVEPASEVPYRIGRRGNVRIEGIAFADDDGQFNPLMATLFWAIWGMKHDPQRLEENLKFLADHDVDGIRILSMVGAASWEDRVIDPRWPDYWQVVERLFKLLKKYGLRVHLTVFADAQVMMPDRIDRDEHQEDWADFANQHRPQFQLIEVANEHWQNGLDTNEVKIRGVELMSLTDIPVALSAPQEHAVADMYRDWPDVATVHYDRNISKDDGSWRPVRQPWGWPGEYFGSYDPKIAVCNSEPIGPGASVAADSDPLRLALSYVTTFVSKNSSYTYHCGAGIRGGGAADVARGRHANLYDYDHTILRAMSLWRKELPAGMANWTRHNAQWGSMPWDGSQHAVENGDIIRAYCATQGHRIVGVILGVKHEHVIIARARMTLRFRHPVTGGLVTQGLIERGHTFVVPAHLPGYVVTGEIQ